MHSIIRIHSYSYHLHFFIFISSPHIGKPCYSMLLIISILFYHMHLIKCISHNESHHVHLILCISPNELWGEQSWELKHDIFNLSSDLTVLAQAWSWFFLVFLSLGLATIGLALVTFWGFWVAKSKESDHKAALPPKCRGCSTILSPWQLSITDGRNLYLYGNVYRLTCLFWHIFKLEQSN